MFITCPDGQHVQYLNDDCYKSSSSKGGVVVRQSYPIRPLGSVKEKPASEEISRTIMTDGTVIRVSLSLFLHNLPRFFCVDVIFKFYSVDIRVNMRRANWRGFNFVQRIGSTNHIYIKNLKFSFVI